MISEVYVVYDSWTAKNAYFSTRDLADEFVEQERYEEAGSSAGRYSIYQVAP